MVAKAVIILTAGRGTYAAGGALDQLILEINKMGKTAVLVVGPDGDELMRCCTNIDSCEMVFDPNFEGGLFSSIKAGLEAVNSPAFVLPLSSNGVLNYSEWKSLEDALRETNDSFHVIRPVTQNGAKPLFPQVITKRGLLPLKALPATTDWENSEKICIQDVFVNTPNV